MQKDKITFRQCRRGDDLVAVAKYIHQTDPYIYPSICPENDPLFVDIIKKCFIDEENIYSCDNIFLALCEERIIGLLVAVKCGERLSFTENLSLSDAELAMLKKANDGYFIPLMEESLALCGRNITNLCIDRDFRHAGVGKRLLHFYFGLVKGESVFLDVLKDNEPAIRLYERCGFKIIKEYEGFSGIDSPVKCYHMMRDGSVE